MIKAVQEVKNNQVIKIIIVNKKFNLYIKIDASIIIHLLYFQVNKHIKELTNDEGNRDVTLFKVVLITIW